MSNYSGNACLSGDIATEVGTAFSEAMITAFQACDDINNPLSPLQKKEIASCYMSVFLDMRDRIHRIMELDSIARICYDDPEGLKSMFDDIKIEYIDTEDEE